MLTKKEILLAPIIENTEMYKVYVDDVHMFYYIKPAAGYVLHDNARDWIEIDPETFEEMHIRGYSRGMSSCRSDYDFAENSREIYAIPEIDVITEHIF